MAEVAEVVDRAFRLDAGRAVAALIGAIHDFDLAEEAWQDACEQALRIWPKRGVPRRLAAACQASPPLRVVIAIWPPEN